MFLGVLLVLGLQAQGEQVSDLGCSRVVYKGESVKAKSVMFVGVYGLTEAGKKAVDGLSKDSGRFILTLPNKEGYSKKVFGMDVPSSLAVEAHLKCVQSLGACEQVHVEEVTYSNPKTGSVYRHEPAHTDYKHTVSGESFSRPEECANHQIKQAMNAVAGAVKPGFLEGFGRYLTRESEVGGVWKGPGRP